VRRTSARDLVIAFVTVGLIAYLLVRWRYTDLPPLRYLSAAPLAALAVVEFVVARRVRAAVRHDPGAKAMTAITIARAVALGKASSLVAAGVAGAAVGLLVRVLPDADMVRAAASDSRVAASILAASGVLVAAGLVLERAGIDPNRSRRP